MGDIWPKRFYHATCLDGRKFFSQEEIPDDWVSNPANVQPIETQPEKKTRLTPLPNWDEEEHKPVARRGRPPKEK